MKKLAILFIIFLTTIVTAQERGPEIPPCIISGPSQIYVDEGPYTFSIPNNLGQCAECYDWDIIPGTGDANIGFDQNNSLAVYPTGIGSFHLRVTFFDETGCHTCTKAFNITENNCAFDAALAGKSHCNGNNGDGNLKLDINITDTTNITEVIYIFDVAANGNHYQNFEFDNSGSNGISILADPANSEFNAHFSHDGPCASQGLFYFDLIIKFDNGCPDYTANDVPVNLQTGEPLQLYPNPAMAESEISFEGIELDEISNISIIDFSGIPQRNIKPTNQNISTKGLKPGIYIVSFETTNNGIIQKKLVIE